MGICVRGSVAAVLLALIALGFGSTGTAVAVDKEVTLQDAIKARTEVTVLMEEAAELDPEVRQSMRKVLEARAKAITAENAAKAEPVIARLNEALVRRDKFAAEDVLAEIEKLIPSDARMPGLREKVEALPGPKKTLALDLGGGVKMDFVLIRPGSFIMGSESEKPIHKATITKAFYMGKYEVTQEQWKAVMGTDPSGFKGAKNPVENVSWEDCQTFLRKLGAQIPGRALRLPTEAKWEYACRAGSATEYCYGDDAGGLDEYAWYSNNSGQTAPPGRAEET